MLVTIVVIHIDCVNGTLTSGGRVSKNVKKLHDVIYGWYLMDELIM